MQTVWSRVAQVRGASRGASCHPPHGAFSRRATASATRSVPRYFTSSTVLYSGIFAVAATYDAEVKKQRREQWDRAIESVRQELGAGAQTGLDETDVRLLEELKARDWEEVSDLADRSVKGEWTTGSGPPLKARRLAPQSVYASDARQEGGKQRTWTPKKLAIMEVVMDWFQLLLFRTANARGFADEAARAVPSYYGHHFGTDSEERTEEYQALRTALKHLRMADAQLSDYDPPALDPNLLSISNFHQDDYGEHNDRARELTRTVRELFSDHHKGAMSSGSLLGQLSYKLHQSSAAPNIDTFNTILLGFSRAGDNEMFDKAAQMFKQSTIRANELTLVAVLHHYTKTNNPNKFAYWLELIRGKHGGLMLARPDIVITDASEGRLIRHGPDKVIQLPYATPIVFSALVTGVLHFSGFEAALAACQKMGGEGWGLDIRGLTVLLSDCARRGDWESACAVWEQVQLLRINSKRRRHRNAKWQGEKIGLEAFAEMLRLCVRTKRKKQWDELWREAATSHPGDMKKLGALVREKRDDSAPVGMGLVNDLVVHVESEQTEPPGSSAELRWRLDVGESEDSSHTVERAVSEEEMVEPSKPAMPRQNRAPPREKLQWTMRPGRDTAGSTLHAVDMRPFCQREAVASH